MKKKHLIIDSTNLLYRAHFTGDLRDSKGNRTSAIFNSLRMLDVLVKEFRPTSVVLAWDLGKSKGRLAVFPEYKGQRDRYRNDTDKIEIAAQKEILQQIQNLLPVKQVSVQDVEADDIIGYLCGKLKGEKIVVSNDADFIQLVNEDTKLWLPTKLKMITHHNVDKHLGFPVKHYILYKSLVGDSSDNINGVHGIGPVKAAAIIKNGLTGNKKLPLNAEEKKILDRNKYLIKIGAVITDEENALIWSTYMAAKKNAKKPQFKKFKRRLKELNFKQLLAYYEQIETRFRRLRKVQDGKVIKAKK